MIRSTWWKSKLFWVLLAAALYLLAGTLVVPPLVKNQLKSMITTQSPLDPGIESVKFNPITFTLRLRNLTLETSEKTVLDAKKITVNFDPLVSIYRWDWSFGNIEIDSPQVSVTRNKSGLINWTQYRSLPDTPTERAVNTDTPNYTVDRFRLKNGRVDWSDRLRPPEAGLMLSEIDLGLENLHWPASGNSPLKLRSKIGDGGVFRINGTLYADTRTLDSNFRLDNFVLRDLNDYVRKRIQGQWKSGRLDVRGSLRASAAPLTVNLSGKSKMTNLKFVDLNGDTVGGWSKTTIDNIDIKWPRKEFRVGPIDIQSPHLALEINENYRTNLGNLLVPKTQENASPPQQRDISWSGSVGPIRVTSADLNFSDENVPGSFQTNIKDLDGSIGKTSMTGDDTADVSLNGTLGGQSKVSLDGSISLFSFFSRSNITMEIVNVGLPTLSPYSGKFLGYKIDRGKMLLTLKYRIEDGRLSGDNQVVLEDFTLGEYVGNEMIAIPMKLVVSLLKDSDGVIRMSVPVSGNFNDPSFDFSNAIYKAVRSILTSIMKSPFSYLAKLVGSEPDELRFVEFEPAGSRLSQRAVNGLDKLVKVMKQRPLIKIGVRPGWSESDRRKFASRSLDSYLNRQGGNQNNLSQSVFELETRYSELTSPKVVSGIQEEHKLEEGPRKGTTDEEAYAQELYEKIVEKTRVNPDKLQELAQKRASNIREYLREQEIQPERIFILDPNELNPDLSDPAVKIPLTVKAR